MKLLIEITYYCWQNINTMESNSDFKNINHKDVDLIAVSEYIKRINAYSFVMKYKDKVYDASCECNDGDFGSGVFIKLFEKYFVSKKSNVLFLKKIPLYELNGKKYTIMIKMNFKHSNKIITKKLCNLHTYNRNRIAYESDTFYHDDNETVTYRKQILQFTYYIYTFTYNKHNKHNKHKHNSPKLYREPILLVKSTIEMNEYEPWNHSPTGYILAPCITKCDLTFNEADYRNEWDEFEMMRTGW